MKESIANLHQIGPTKEFKILIKHRMQEPALFKLRSGKSVNELLLCLVD